MAMLVFSPVICFGLLAGMQCQLWKILHFGKQKCVVQDSEMTLRDSGKSCSYRSAGLMY